MEITIGRPGLEKILHQAIPDQDYAPSELYTDLMRLPWNDVFTTNYDTLLERGAETVTNRRYNVVVCQEDLVNSNDAPRIIKLHGSFPSQRPFIITEEDYRTYPVSHAAMVNTVQQALLENVFCMIGFSCEDPNFIHWVGWIHDHLGKSCAQKIYMVSVSHVAEAKQKLLLDRNIIVVDLQNLWPDSSVRDRVKKFFTLLQKNVEKKEQEQEWFQYADISFREADYAQRIQKLKELRNAYPGWIFLPWKMRKRVDYLLHEVRWLNQKELQKLALDERIRYFYEYVKILDIAGCPMLVQHAEIISTLIDDVREADKDLQRLLQEIYLQLLRTCRETEQWDKYEEYHARIEENLLDYDGIQFLRAEECRYDFFRFRADSLAEKLEKWKTAGSDIYWPLVKAYFHAITGDRAKAENILTDNLVLVRKQLMKNAKSEYLSSVEESNVSLLNFIRQSTWRQEQKFENCIHEGDLSWWTENENYCLHLQVPQMKEQRHEQNYNFDLSVTYTSHFGSSEPDVMTALEYWRFFEQTGHAFRLGMVTNKEGLENSVKRMAGYYPYWSFMQILVAQEEKYVDYLYGRVKLAGMSAEEANEEMQEYMRIFTVLTEKVDAEHFLFPETIYEQAAGVLPVILSRLCYKASVEVLDKMLDLLFRLVASNKKYSFRKLRPLLKGIMNAYTVEQQAERLPKLLEFPMDTDRTIDYEDPIGFVERLPKEKITLGETLYTKVMMQIRLMLDSDKEEERGGAINRLTILQQIITLKPEEEKFLFERLRQRGRVRDSYLLYALDQSEPREQLDEILENTVKQMEQDASFSGFSSRGSEYVELLRVANKIDFTKHDIRNIFSVMQRVLEASAQWEEAKERIRECVIISQKILISLCLNPEYKVSDEEKTAVTGYLQEAAKIYEKDIILPVLYQLLTEGKATWDDLTINLWACGDRELDLIHSFVWNVEAKEKKEVSPELAEILRTISQVLCYRLMGVKGMEAEQILLVIESLAENDRIPEVAEAILDAKLHSLITETAIAEEDTEEIAIRKLKSRIQACIVAGVLYHKGKKYAAVEEWHRIHEDKDEYVEIRKVIF